jgi:tetratricopeptide (TPR) repeat protein
MTPNRLVNAWSVIVLLLVAGAANGQAAKGTAELELVPHPDLSQLKPEVRELLQPAVDYFRQQRATLEGRQLGLAYGRMGINYLAHEQQEAAAACLRNAVLLDPDNSRWPYLLAVHYEETGFLDKAVDSYRAALILDRTYVPGYIRLGRVLLELNRLEEAEAAFQVVLNVVPDDAAALAGEGRVAFERDQFEKAAGLFERALAKEPEASSLHYRLGLTYRALGEADKARDELGKAGERIPTTNDPLLAYVQAHTRGAEHYLEGASQAEAAGQPLAAIKLYDIATSIDPSNVEALLKLGELQGTAGQTEGALATFGRLLSIDPANARANYFVGTILEQQGQDEEARRYYEKALETEPQLVEPRMLLANAQMRAGEYELAGDNYAQIAHQLPGAVDVMYLLGVAWLAAGECQWADPVLFRAVKMAPEDRQISTALVRAYSTCPQSTEDQRKQALTVARGMYDQHPDMETCETLAMASAANGEFEEAVDAQAQAIFEALKAGNQDQLTWMQGNMQRYQAGQPAEKPWSADADVYKPSRLAPPPAG